MAAGAGVRVFITGANRGIGLGLARAFKAEGAEIVAAVRRSAPELDEIASKVITGVDVTQADGLAALETGLEGEGAFDVAINNAGILRRDSLDKLSDSFDDIAAQFATNSLAPLRVTSVLLDKKLVKKDGKLVFITSRMGSIADNTSGGYYGYRMSKVALNIACVSLARDLAEQGIHVGIYHPGMVQTEMTGGRGIPVEESVAGLKARIAALDASNSGKFFHENGEELPW